MNSQPKVSIIILNWNGLKDTLECLSSLIKIDYSSYKVFVVDNGSKGDDAAIIKQKFPSVNLVINSTNLGFAEGNNVALRQLLKQGQTDYFLLLNNDTTVTKNFLTELIRVAKLQPQSGILGPKIYFYPDQGKNNRLQSIGSSLNLSLGKIKPVSSHSAHVQEVDFVTGACLLIKAPTIQKIGYLDKQFFCLFEDVDWCYRAKRASFDILYVPSSLIYHKAGQTIIRISPVYYYTRNLFWFEFKHASPLQLLVFLFSYFLTVFPVYFFGYLVIKKNYPVWKSYLRGLKDGIFSFKRSPK